MNSEPGTVPFSITADPAGDLVIAEAGPSALATFALHADGTIAQIDAVDTGQAATCWVTADGGQLFTSNAGGNGNVDEYSVTAGMLTEVGSVTVPGAVGGKGAQPSWAERPAAG